MELGNISDYDDETIEAGNQAFFLWEEHELEKAEPFLKIAAEKRYSYSMGKYAFILIHFHQQDSSKLRQAAKLMLMGALRKEEFAIDYVRDLDIRDSEGNDLIELIRQAPTEDVVKWLRGESKKEIKQVELAIQSFCDAVAIRQANP